MKEDRSPREQAFDAIFKQKLAGNQAASERAPSESAGQLRSLDVATCSPARRVPVEVRAPGFFARWELAPDKLDELLSLVGDSIVAANVERMNEESARQENKADSTTCT